MPYDQKVWRQLLEAAQPSSTQAERWVGEADSLQTKPVALFSEENWGVGGLELKHKKSFISFRTASPSVPGQVI